jgi:hypothetical protein
MKILVTDYTFTPSTKRIVFNSYININLEQLLLITNATTNTIIYNFAKPELGAEKFNANTITLDFNTASMNAADRLQIFIEAPTEALNTTTASLSNRAVLSAAAIYEVNGISTFGQFQFFQIRSGQDLNTSNLLYSCYLKPTDNFNIKFDKGLNIPSGVVHMLNSSNPITVNLNDNNLLFTTSYIK